MSRKFALVISTVALLLPAMLPIAQAQSPPGTAYGGPGLFETTLFADQTIDVGTVSIWNSPKKAMVRIEPSGDWQIAATQIYVGYPEVDPIPVKRGNPVLGKFPYRQEYETPVSQHQLTLDLKEDLDFSWGSQSRDLRIPTFAVHADLVILNDLGEVVAAEGTWAFGPTEFEGSQWGWTGTYELAHPRRGHFIDSPVMGLSYRGPTQQGVTSSDEGGFLFPGRDLSVDCAPH